MPKKPQLAKLTRPRLYKAVARERLFKLLDEKREHPVVWIVGPPGAGKTTLVASYLEEAGVPAIWYQIDAGDSDPATFFFYLKQAVERLSQGESLSLPLFTPEYLREPAEFSRRFFRQAFAMLAEGFVLVLDNYQESAADSGLQACLSAALAEIPSDSNLVIVSRADPPAAFATSVVNQTIASVSWEELRLAQDETAAIALARGITDQEIVHGLYQHSSGWVAGVTFMLERIEKGDSIGVLRREEGVETVFEYFAGLFFDKLPAQFRDALMRMALLPRVSANLAEGVTGDPHAIKHLEALHKRHLFTDRRLGQEITYQFHALFRAFLQTRAKRSYSPAEWNEIAERAANSLESEGQTEDAFALYAEAANWDAAEKLVLELAPSLIAQGRWQTLEEHIGMIPAQRSVGNPWIRYWLGRSRTFMDSRAARSILESAFESFLAAGEEVGQLLCATTILEGRFFEFDDLRPMDPWIAVVVDLLQRGVRIPSKEDELRVHSVVMMGATFRAPQHSMLGTCLHRVEELLKEPFDANLKVATATMLLGYSNVSMDPEAERIADQVAQPLLGSKHLSPLCAMRFWSAKGYTQYVYGRYSDSLTSFNASDTIAEAHMLEDAFSIAFSFRRGLCERRAGLLEEAESTIRRVESLSAASGGLPSGRHFTGGLDLLKAGTAFDRGDFPRAIEAVLSSFRAFDRAGHFNAIILVGIVAANMAIAANRFDIASGLLDRLLSEDYGSIAGNYLAAIRLNEAWLAHRRNQVEDRGALLADALQRARDERARVRLRWYQNAMSELLPVALSFGIETDIATQLVREFDVPPVGLAPEHWPWPIKIYTLGRFELLIDEQIPIYSRKVPRKVLGLLKVIIAFGCHAVSEEKILDALWPDDEADSARRSLTATLHRLRKLLKNPNAIRQAGGELALNNRYCWVDAEAFESRMDAGDGAVPAILMYRGAFLAREDAPWAMPVRERLRAKFIQGVGKQCIALEADGKYEQAIELYSRGIDADELVEPFHQGLMRCYGKLNRRAEAASAYRRLRQTLSLTLGVAPSSASQHLFEALRLD